MKRKIQFSQLWVEEERYLRDEASLLEKNSIIVEIGTAQGGSAYLFATSVKAKNVPIYTYDLCPSNEAFENLRGLMDAHIISKPSAVGAKEWPRKYGKPINLLFIDGSHTLENIYLDFISWFPHVKIGGKILFHDFDPIYKGGSAHLGVEVFIGALQKLDILSDAEHVGRIFAGTKKKQIRYNQLIEECSYALENIGKKVKKFMKFDFGHCDFIGYEDNYTALLRELRGFKGKTFRNLNKISLKNNVVILPRPLSKDVIERISKNNNFVILDELVFFYLLYDSMLNNRDKVLAITKNRKAYFKWEELLEMHNHSHNFKGTVRGVFSVKNRDIKNISKICARELVRLNILNNIFFAINGEI